MQNITRLLQLVTKYSVTLSEYVIAQAGCAESCELVRFPNPLALGSDFLKSGGAPVSL